MGESRFDDPIIVIEYILRVRHQQVFSVMAMKDDPEGGGMIMILAIILNRRERGVADENATIESSLCRAFDKVKKKGTQDRESEQLGDRKLDLGC